MPGYPSIPGTPAIPFKRKINNIYHYFLKYVISEYYSII